MVYITLFGISFLAATLLPLGSEGLLLYDVTKGYNLLLLWLFATLGNTLGSMVNYAIGLKGEDYLEKRGHLSSKNMTKARATFSKYGAYSLLLSWVPIIGDPLTFIAGVLHYNFKLFTFVVFIAKGLRYAVIMSLAI